MYMYKFVKGKKFINNVFQIYFNYIAKTKETITDGIKYSNKKCYNKLYTRLNNQMSV